MVVIDRPAETISRRFGERGGDQGEAGMDGTPIRLVATAGVGPARNPLPQSYLYAPTFKQGSLRISM